jgi:hypothetical protein
MLSVIMLNLVMLSVMALILIPYRSNVFTTINHFHPSLIFAGKARAYLFDGDQQQALLELASALPTKNKY